MVLPANQAGHAGADGLVYQQVVQGAENRAQEQGDHGHPDQLGAVDLEEIGGRRALGQVDDAAQIAEQRDFDQCADQAHHQQGGEMRPHLAQVVEVEGQDFIGRRGAGRVAENIDQLFKTTIEH